MDPVQSRPRVVLVNRSLVIDSHQRILIIQRANDDSYSPGWWELPGGKLDEGQDVSQALEREVLEETGLLVMPTNRVAYFESKLLNAGKYAGLTYIVLIGVSNVVGGEVELSHEHQAYEWVTPKTALDFKLTDETRKAILALSKTMLN